MEIGTCNSCGEKYEVMYHKDQNKPVCVACFKIMNNEPLKYNMTLDEAEKAIKSCFNVTVEEV